ncbi:MAG: cation:proton antiporter [Sedimentisphaerales bacterium]|nr:cation:proton antiporter [Sedimentisphaerales bacterium]
MSPLLLIGITIFGGFVGGEVAKRVRLPKVTGYILAGVFLNPGVLGIIPVDFPRHTDVVTNIALSFITFSVGGTLLFSRVRKLGKGILAITILEAETAFVVVTLGIAAVSPFLLRGDGTGWLTTYIPVALLMGCLASPTDPSATLAVVHEYRARGQVTSTILGVTAFDDVTGIINFSLAVALAQILIQHDTFGLASAVLAPARAIFGAILLGAAFGFAFYLLVRVLPRETEGALIVAVLAMLTLCFGAATYLGVDELLATMTMGVVVVNYNPLSSKIFKVLERYTEELVFVLFFTLSGMNLDLSVLVHNLALVCLFVVFRSAGKLLGATAGAALAHSPSKVRKYVAGGLVPQGGIVVGLALLMKQNPALTDVADVVISVIIGATVIHELVGPIVSRAAIRAAGEIPAGHTG